MTTTCGFEFSLLKKTDIVRYFHSLFSCYIQLTVMFQKKKKKKIQLTVLYFSLFLTGDLFCEEIRQENLANPTKKPIP